jgi:hypothetical protein
VESKTSKLPNIEAVQPRPALIPLSYSQERLWFMDQLEGSVEYHTTAAFRLSGHLDVSALEYSLRSIIDRHEVLRTVFKEHDGQPYQYIKDKGNWRLSLVDGRRYKGDSNSLSQLIERVISEPFNLSSTTCYVRI